MNLETTNKIVAKCDIFIKFFRILSAVFVFVNFAHYRDALTQCEKTSKTSYIFENHEIELG